MHKVRRNEEIELYYAKIPNQNEIVIIISENKAVATDSYKDVILYDCKQN